MSVNQKIPLTPIKPVSHIWRRLLEENRVPMDGIVVEVAPGYEKKIGDGLAMLGFRGTVILIEPDEKAAAHVCGLYAQIMPGATVRAVTKNLQEIEIGKDIPRRVDALVANHPFDDMALSFAMHGAPGSIFSQEHDDDIAVSARVKELYAAISDRDYIHGILATIVVWKNFIKKLKPRLFIASQYPSRKLTLKKLTKRQNSGFIVVELLRDYYDSYLKELYQAKSFGQQGDPAWWIVAQRPYTDLVSDLGEQPVAMERLSKEIFVPQQARHLNPAEYDVVYVDETYFKESGYGDDARDQSKQFAIELDRDRPATPESLTVYADRQKDATDVGLSGNLGSGRAVYYGKRHNVLGVGKTSLCLSTKPSHSTGKMEIIGALRRVILSHWISSFRQKVVRHPVVIALKETAATHWSAHPLPLSLLVRVDDGALDRPSHVEYDPTIKVDFKKTMSEYAKLDAEYFAYRLMLGAWSTGNYSLDGHMIDLETASFVKYRGPYHTSSSKYQHNYFGYEGLGFLRILEQLAAMKKIRKLDIDKLFKEERRGHLALCLLALLGVDDAQAAALFSKYPDRVLTLTDQFERLAKKISPKRMSLNLYLGVSDADDPSLLDMSGLFRDLARLNSKKNREARAMDRLVRKSALAQVRPGLTYEPQQTSEGQVNRGEIFIKENAVVTRDQLDKFLAETKIFVRDLFALLDTLRAEKCLPARAYWHDQLQTINQDFPIMSELNEKLKYCVEEYRVSRINPETLGVEIEKLCALPHYPTGANLDLKDIPLLDYLKPNRRELALLSLHLETVDFSAGQAIVREGEDADALFIMVQGTCAVRVGGREISKIGNRGALIGEAVIFEDNPKRTATVLAETPARLLRLDKKNLEKLRTAYPKLRKLLANVLAQRKEGLTDKIRDLDIFNGVNPEDLRLFFAERASEKRFKKDADLITQGKKTPGVYVLLRGSVTLRQAAPDSKREPIELEDAPLTEGLFGERSTILDRGAICTVAAHDEVTALFISKKDFRALLDKYPQLLRNCLDRISDYVQSNKDRASLISKLEKRLGNLK